MMRLLKKLLTISIIGGIIFVGIGDRFLPKPLSAYSRDTRNALNAKLLGLMPQQKKVDRLKERVKDHSDPGRIYDRGMEKMEKGNTNQ
ncbi:MAG: hypothetical protein VKJ02_13915 [Snowella sp.]|nr:hypothetical protein [Snowella sp.]